ncbi:helix-turn-helix domain-containing protein [Jatrophihabitans sp. YIM 134969]
MARQRGFDEADAVATAARLFTERGYEGTSIDDLVTGLGVHRGSLYRVFGSKLALFHRALRTHVEAELLPWIATLPGSERGPLVEGARPGTPDVDLGLLLVAAVERAPTDPVAAAEVDRVFTALTGALHTDPPADGAVADGLAAALVGLHLRSRAGAPGDVVGRAAAALSERVGI